MSEKTNYTINLKVWKKQKNGDLVFKREYPITNNLGFAMKRNNYGNMDVFVDIDDFVAEKDSTYYCELALEYSDGNILDTAKCYFQVV